MYSGAERFPRFGGKIWIDAHGSCSYECALCRNTFFSAGSYEFHNSMAHSNNLKSNVSVPLNNNWNVTKPSSSHGDREVGHFSANWSAHANAHNESNDCKRGQEQSNQLICTKCNNRYDNLAELRAHVLNHHQFDCVYCPRGTIKTYETQQGLWGHQRKHHEATFPYQCKVCPRAFKRRDELKEHKQSKHVRGNDVQCDFCSKKLMSAFAKENHIKKEHSNRRYYCFLCTGYWSTSQKNLRQHMNKKHPGRSQPNE